MVVLGEAAKIIQMQRIAYRWFKSAYEWNLELLWQFFKSEIIVGKVTLYHIMTTHGIR